MATKKYGVIYTPQRLADFIAELLYKEAARDNFKIEYILDPACGEGALLGAASRFFGDGVSYSGIDVDKDAISGIINEFDIKYNDAILPRNVKRRTSEYWKEKLPAVSAIIANPPWSSEKIYRNDTLTEAGFGLIKGQYDSYVLFIELAFNLIVTGGYFAFIVPDSLFEAQNEQLRRFLTKNTQIKVIARLGEKIFEEVNRAATILVCKKANPDSDSKTKCFRLTTDRRKEFLTTERALMDFYNSDYHEVLQSRFAANVAYSFDVDARSDEEELLQKIKTNSIDWDKNFVFGRGVEISKSGKIVCCSFCGYAQGYKKAQLETGNKVCTNCNNIIPVTSADIQIVVQKKPVPESAQIYVGENVRRYSLNGKCYIQLNKSGINYKNQILYSPPKLLIRKTGLGINCAIDYSGSMTTQTVYILKAKDRNSTIPLEYYLALLNSRVVYYYYLKAYGENEWKSHPYFTKQIIFSLPLKQYESSELDEKIVAYARILAKKYTQDKDLELEKLIMRKYGLEDSEIQLVINEVNKLPNLSAINNMKIKDKFNV